MARLLLLVAAPTAALGFMHAGAFSRPHSGPGLSQARATSPFSFAERVSCSRGARARQGLCMSTDSPANTEITTEVTLLGNSSAAIAVEVSGRITQQCYDKSMRAITKELGPKIPGFSGMKNQQIPPQIIMQYAGEEAVKSRAMEHLFEDAINQALNQADVHAIGQAELISDQNMLLEFYNPGQPLKVEVKVDVWPEVVFTGEYTGLEVTAMDAPFDQERYNLAIENLRERYVDLADTEEGYAAQLGDSVITDMDPYEELPDGSRGEPLPAVASGREVDVVLAADKYMPGLIEGLVGVKQGEKREVRVTFPEQLRGAAQGLQGKKAIFDVTAVDIKKRNLPNLDDKFANSIREGLTWEELQAEVVASVGEDEAKRKLDNRNLALEQALQDVTSSMEMPETLITEKARQKFAVMLTEFKDQGEDDEKIQKMISKENFEKYKEVVRTSTTRQLQASLVMEAIAKKEGITVDEADVEDQLELMRAEAKGQEFDEKAAKEQIEATLQKNLVLEWVAERSTISYVPPPPVDAMPGSMA